MTNFKDDEEPLLDDENRLQINDFDDPIPDTNEPVSSRLTPVAFNAPPKYDAINNPNFNLSDQIIAQSPKHRYVHCKVCHEFINVTNLLTQAIVKCKKCKEATALRAAPPGKQYIRCPCNCLLIVKISSQRVLCPRANCNRTIRILSKQEASDTASVSSRKNDQIYSPYNPLRNPGSQVSLSAAAPVDSNFQSMYFLRKKTRFYSS